MAILLKTKLPRMLCFLRYITVLGIFYIGISIFTVRIWPFCYRKV